MNPPRIIKKYPNRRLYDTSVSLYITLEDVKKLVIDQIPFQVVDQRTGEEITRSILFQVISEQEDHGVPLFTTEVLEQIIRFYGNTFQSSLSEFLTKSMALFTEQHTQFHKQVEQPLLKVPATLTDLAEHNFALWKKWQESLFFPFGLARKQEEDDKKKKEEERSS